MTPAQYVELLEFIANNNCWGIKMYDCAMRHRRCFKYVNACFDTRDGHIWRIELRVSGADKGKIFRIESDEDIEKIYAFLNEQI